MSFGVNAVNDIQVDPYETCITLETLLNRYKEDRGVWRHQYKALIVQDYLLNHGSAIFVELSRKYKRYAWLLPVL